MAVRIFPMVCGWLEVDAKFILDQQPGRYKLPIPSFLIEHPKGRAVFDSDKNAQKAIVAMRYVDNRGKPTDLYPYNPSGTPEGITGLTTVDGRFTIVMPHPERVFRNVQMSWAPDDAGEDSPWMQMFYNARRWVG